MTKSSSCWIKGRPWLQQSFLHLTQRESLTKPHFVMCAFVERQALTEVCVSRHGVCPSGLFASSVGPLHLLLPGAGLLHLWYLQTHLYRWVEACELNKVTNRFLFKADSCVWFVTPGTFAVISIMIGSVTARLAPDSNFVINGTNGTEDVNVGERDSMRVQIACSLTVLAGIFQVCFKPYSLH